MLGPLLVRRDGRPVLIGSVKQRLLLGVLALQPDQVVRRDELVDVLWGERTPRSCHSLIHTYVARLRRLLEPPGIPDAAARVLVAGGGGYRLMVDGSQLDLLRFDALAAKARAVRAADPSLALELFAEALGCWRGRLLADLPGMLDRHPAAVAVAQRRTATVLACADLALELGRPQQAVEQLRGLAHAEPLHEGVHARLMLALAGSGQQAAALEVYTGLRARLAEELGIEPGNELNDAQARVLRGDLPPAHSPARGPVTHLPGRFQPAQLPMDVAAFTGRDGHLQQLDAVLPDGGAPPPTAVAAAAITGMAGVGKTALAVHWAHRVADRFGDGQLYIDLRGYADTPPLDPLHALAALLAGLGVEAQQIPTGLDAAAGLYRSLLAGKRVLVVLDNARNAAQVRPLLPGQPGCMVLITGRDGLTGLVATHGVHRLSLEVLTPGEAVALLGRLLGEERVAAEPEAAEELARTCGWLPLALRIAAANLTSQPGQTVAGYLSELQDGDRLAELAVEGDPQAAVRAAFDHSYRHLSADSRRLFRLLGLVPGPHLSAPAAAALGGGTATQAGRLLRTLVAAHLVEPRGVSRVGLHDLLRAYARQRADQDDSPAERTAALGRLHAWYLQGADTAARVLYPDKLRLPAPASRQDAAVPPAGLETPAGAMAWLEAERANLVTTIQDAAEHGPHPTAWLLADALRGYFWLQRHTTHWLQAAHAGLAAATRAGDVRAQAASRLSLGDAYQATGSSRQAIRHYTAALALAHEAGWADLAAICLDELGMVHFWSGDLRQAADHHTQALELYRQTGRRGGQATALINHSVADRTLGRLQQAASRQRHALNLHRQLGSRQGMANALGHLGVTLHDLGRLDHAQQCLTRALSLYRAVGDRFGQAWVGCALAGVHRDTGRHPQALETAQAALRLAGEIGHRPVQAAAHTTLASVHRRLGHHQQAIQHDQRALDLARQTRARAVEVQALCGLAAAGQHTGQPTHAVDHAEQARAIAAQAGFEVLEGQAHTALAAAHLTLGHHQQARSHAEHALKLHRQTGHRLGQARTLHLLSQSLAGSGDAQAAVVRREALQLFADVGSPEADQLHEPPDPEQAVARPASPFGTRPARPADTDPVQRPVNQPRLASEPQGRPSSRRRRP